VLEEIAERLAVVLRRQDEIESRFLRLEAALGIKPEPAVVPSQLALPIADPAAAPALRPLSDEPAAAPARRSLSDEQAAAPHPLAELPPEPPRPTPVRDRCPAHRRRRLASHGRDLRCPTSHRSPRCARPRRRPTNRRSSRSSACSG